MVGAGEREVNSLLTLKDIPMFGVADYGAFVIAVIIFLLIPGPGNLALITSTSKGGIRGGLASILGVIMGDQVLMWLAVAGVAALLTTYPAAFHAVQWLGAAYLAYLGIRMLLARSGGAPVLHIRAGQYVRQSFAITLLNPKAIVFYMAFFPLFVDPARHQGLATFGFMALTIAALTFAYGLTVTLLTHFLAERMRANPAISSTLGKLAGLFLIGFGIKLAVSR
jgi:leucine efflux protein